MYMDTPKAAIPFHIHHLYYRSIGIPQPNRVYSFLLFVPFLQISLLEKHAFPTAMMAVAGVSRQYGITKRAGMRTEGIFADVAAAGVYNRASAKVAVKPAEMVIAADRAKQGAAFPIGLNDAIAQKRPSAVRRKSVRTTNAAVGRALFPNRRVAVRTDHGLWFLHDPSVHPQHIMKSFPHQTLSKR